MEMQPKRRLTLTLPDEVFHALRHEAFESQRNLNEVIETALRKYKPIGGRLTGEKNVNGK